ncbi:MAG: 50S ribosomal protein L35 [Mycoplasmoidaceae bacterium]|mgnify:CR=1 FL=1|nr:50S ribosomal protein L35 [Mycoplasmoidaceae bacterium]
MAKNKMKTKKSVSKRVKVTATGKLKRKHTNRSHMAHSKSTKQKRHLKKDGIVTKANYKRLKYTLQD